jgi:hypothetical protein
MDSKLPGFLIIKSGHKEARKEGIHEKNGAILYFLDS